MGSRSLLRRTPFLVAWVASVLVLLNRLEPGYWREVVDWRAHIPSSWTARQPEPEASPTRARLAETTAGEEPAVVASNRDGATATSRPPPRETIARATGAGGEPVGRAARNLVPAPSARAETEGRPSSRSTILGPVSDRVARAWQLNTEHRYGEAWAIVRTLPDAPRLLTLRALTALYAHQNDEALRLARTWVARQPANVEARLALVQAHLQRGEVAAARRSAHVLADRGGLDIDEWRRLAALQAWAGDPRAAAESDRAILAERPEDLAARIDLADALVAAGEPEEALAAVRHARRIAPGSPKLSVLAARAHTSLGDRRRASAAYDHALAASPGDVALELEAARYFVNAGAPTRALELYRDVVTHRGASGLRTELARALLATGDYAEAEGVAEDATRTSEDGPDARLALAQSVYLEGRLAESQALFDDAETMGLDRGLGAAWQAQVALARDSHLAAYRLFGDALDRYDRLEADGGAAPGPAPPAGSPAALELDRGRAAEKRGDYGRARSAYESAGELGARLGSAVALDRLADETRTLFGSAYTHFSDANDFNLDGGLVRGDLWADGDAIAVVAQGIVQVVSQHEARYTRTGGGVGVHGFFPRTDLSIAADVGFVNASAGGGDLVTAAVDLRWYREDTSVFGVLGYRDSLLAGHDDLDPRLFNRIIDLAAVTPSFAINGGRLYLDQALRETAGDRLWLSGGVENYQDGNLRGYFYGHYQLPVAQRPGVWAVVRPNAFVEAFKHSDVPNYFSPSSHATIGVAGHAIVEHGRWRIEAEVTPQLLITNGGAGYGGYGLLDASVDLGGVTAGISGFGFYDGRNDYWLAHAMARLEVPF